MNECPTMNEEENVVLSDHVEIVDDFTSLNSKENEELEQKQKDLEGIQELLKVMPKTHY